MSNPKIITIDFESAYGKHPVTQENISLTRLTTEEYVRHPLFKVHGVGIKYDHEETQWYHGDEEVTKALNAVPWDRVACLAHHAHFDGAILKWIYGLSPRFWLDSLSMANAALPWMSSSLAKLAEYLDLKSKGTALVKTQGIWDLTPQLAYELGEYCKDDVDICRGIYDRLLAGFYPDAFGVFPKDELLLIDMTVRMFTEPMIEIDGAVLVEEYARELRAKRAFMKKSGVDRKTLMSNSKFAEKLLSLGVEPPTKVSPTTGKTTYAFAKADEKFKLLLEHQKEEVRWLVEARMSVKSTIKETRAKRFFKIGKRGAFPVYLKYYGAHSGRWSGGDKQNAQNMTRYNPKDPTSGALRRSWIAPKGYMFVVCDLSQIEARMLAYWAGQDDLVEAFRNKIDPYCHAASGLYGREIIKAEHPAERQVGKATILGCGYSLGWKKFQEALRVGFLGMDPIIFDDTYVEQLEIDVAWVLKQRDGFKGPTVFEAAMLLKPAHIDQRTHLIHCAVTKVIIDRYRGTNSKIVSLWSEAKAALKHIARGTRTPLGQNDLVKTSERGLMLPNGMQIQYHKLRKEQGEKNWKYLSNAQRKQWSYIYGGKCVENGTQSLARIVLSDQALILRKEMRVVSTTHDEVIALLPEVDAEAGLARMIDVMSVSPEWAPDLPLSAEGGIAERYGYCEH